MNVMSRSPEIFGVYKTSQRWIHKIPVFYKFLALLILALILFLPLHRWIPSVPLWLVPSGALAAIMLLGATGGIGWKSWWSTLRPALLIFAVLAAYHVLVGTPDRGAAVLIAMTAAMFSIRILLETTPQAHLLDAVVKSMSLLRVVGINPERIGLAIHIMLRTIPLLLAVTQGVRDAAHARGVRIGPVKTATPLAVWAVAHAQKTGDALAARGLD